MSANANANENANDAQEHRIDRAAFVAWCEDQTGKSQSPTSRIIVNDDERIRFRLREGDDIEDIVLVKGKNVDTLRFENGDGPVVQFHAHKRTFTFHDKTLIVRHADGDEITRAGTGTRSKKGPFPRGR